MKEHKVRPVVTATGFKKFVLRLNWASNDKTTLHCERIKTNSTFKEQRPVKRVKEAGKGRRMMNQQKIN